MIVEKYVLRAFIPPFLLGLFVFVFILLTNYFVRFFSIAAARGMDIARTLPLTGLLLPYLISTALPMACLLGVLLALGQLSHEGEITAFRACGFSFPQILWPLGALSLIFSGLLFFMNHYVSPRSMHAFKEAHARALQTVSDVRVEPRTFLTLGDWKLFPQKVDSRRNEIFGVSLYRFSSGQPSLRVNAERGAYRVEEGEGLHLELQQGTIQIPGSDPSKLTLANFEKYRVFIPFPSPDGFSRSARSQELDLGRMRSKIASLPPGSPEASRLKAELALRSAVAFSPLLFFWIGCPLGLKLEKRSRTWGFALSLLILFGYYGLLVFSLQMAQNFPAFSSGIVWVPNVLGFLAGGALVRRLMSR